ncbi:MAG: 6-phosphofructokinase [Lachnospiraceae bacterium]|jgi:6-phosphofructokinase
MNILAAQSGGPTAAINASLAGVIEKAAQLWPNGKIYGGCNGIQGVLEEHIVDLKATFCPDGKPDKDLLSRLAVTPAMYLGSCRYRMKNYEDDPSDYEVFFDIVDKLNIDAFFYIGGNDSMDTVQMLSDYAEANGKNLKIVGVPKTIDNDLMGIDHTPGFGSAARFVATEVREIALDTDIYLNDSVVIVEIMGRDAGWLTAASALARMDGSAAPHLIYLPELGFDTEDFLRKVKTNLFRYHHVVACVSEGLKDVNGEYLLADRSKVDKFGHTALAGTGRYLRDQVATRIGCKVRCVELNVTQRAAGHCASGTDLKESRQLGAQAVSLAEAGESGVMASLKRTSDEPYTVEYGSVDVHDVADRVKTVPLSWITPDETGVTEEMIQYLRPLIEGDPDIPEKDGLPDYLRRKI